MPRNAPVSDKNRVLAMRLQAQVIDRFATHVSDLKLKLKSAKALLEESIRDLKYLAGETDNTQVAAGRILVDPKTGEIKGYEGIEPEDDGDEPAAPNQRVGGPRKLDQKSRAAGERDEED